MERVEIGSNAVAGAGVEVNIWEGDTEGKEFKYNIYPIQQLYTLLDGGRVVSVWTVEGCVPVSERYYSTRTGFIVSE